MSVRDAVDAMKRDPHPSFAGPPLCPDCGKRHFLPYNHAGQCTVKGCAEPVLVHDKKPGLFCSRHSVEDGDRIRKANLAVDAFVEKLPKNRGPAFVAASAELAALMPKPEPEWIPPQSLNPKATRRFYVRSRSRPTQEHLVQLLPTLLVCSCEAGRTGHRCKHKEVVEAFLLEGAREIPIDN